MSNATRTEQRKAKIRFVALYVFSLLLLFVVMTAFWRRLSPAANEGDAPKAEESEQYFLQIDTLLHQRMERLDGVYAAAVEGKQRGEEASPALTTVRREFSTILDSLEQQASYLGEGPKKTAMQSVSGKFRRAFTDRERMMNAVFALPKLQMVQTASTTATPSSEVDELKRQLQEKDNRIAALSSGAQTTGTGEITQQLAEKDKTIATLQTQLRQKDAALQAAGQSRPAASGGEWQQKYGSLKASYDRVSASEKNLKTAYQALAEDNRRLLSQIQAQRKN